MDIQKNKSEIKICEEITNINRLLIQLEEDKQRYILGTQHHLTLIAEGEWNRKNQDLIDDLLQRKQTLKQELTRTN